MPEAFSILHVEDDPDHAELVRRALAKRAPESTIEHVLDGQAALDHLADEALPQPDLILLDLQIPKVKGLEVLRQLKADERLRRIPVVVFTTSTAAADRNTAYDLHVNSYQVKQGNYKTLGDQLDDMNRYWSNWNRPPD